MSEEMQNRSQHTAGHIPGNLKPKEDNSKEINPVIKSKTVRGTEKRVALSDRVAVDEKIRKTYEPTGAIPKRFGNVKYASTMSTHFGTLKIPQSSSELGARRVGSIFPKSKFSIFDEAPPEKSFKIDAKPIVDPKKLNMKFIPSAPILEGTEPFSTTQAAFTRAKDFFKEQEFRRQSAGEPHAEREKKREFRRRAKLYSLDEINRNPAELSLPHLRVKEIIQQISVAKVTPHDVPPPVPERIKVVHKSIQDQEEDITKNAAVSQREEVDWPYGDDYMKSQVEKDKFRSFSPNYRDLNASTEQRQTVVHFLIRVGTHSSLPSFIMYQAVRVFDDMLQARRIPLEDLQLMIISALWIIMKKDYIAYRIPGAQKMANYSDGLYTDIDVRSGEKQIVEALNFRFSYPDPFSILMYFVDSLNHIDFMTDDQKESIYYFGSYMLDLALLDEQLIKVSSILLAATAAELATALTLEPDNSPYHSSVFQRWRPPYASSHLKADDIAHYRGLLIRNITESGLRTSKSHTIYKKYSRSRYGKVAMKLIEKIKNITATDIAI